MANQVCRTCPQQLCHVDDSLDHKIDCQWPMREWRTSRTRKIVPQATEAPKWTEQRLKAVGGPAEPMDEVILNTTSQLTTADLAAVIAYLRSLPALPEQK